MKPVKHFLYISCLFWLFFSSLFTLFFLIQCFYFYRFYSGNVSVFIEYYAFLNKLTNILIPFLDILAHLDPKDLDLFVDQVLQQELFEMFIKFLKEKKKL